jgi:hypothetical protein
MCLPYCTANTFCFPHLLTCVLVRSKAWLAACMSLRQACMFRPAWARRLRRLRATLAAAAVLFAHASVHAMRNNIGYQRYWNKRTSPKKGMLAVQSPSLFTETRNAIRYPSEFGVFAVHAVCVCWCLQKGETALHVAAKHGKADIVDLLMQRGAYLGARSKVSCPCCCLCGLLM